MENMSDFFLWKIQHQLKTTIANKSAFLFILVIFSMHKD